MIQRSRLAGFAAVIAAALVIAAAPASQALTILSPVEGSAVREKVKIAVPRSEVKDGGFITVLIDGQFQASAGISGDPAATQVSYIWDTKAPRVNARGEQEFYRDGPHEIEVAIHSFDGVRIESKKITVRIANKAPVSNPPAPVRLSYRYRTGDISKYRVNVRGELLDSTGSDLMGGQAAFTSSFEVGQWIEDVRADGTALVRYKLTEPPKMTLMGQPIALAEPGQEMAALPSSLYRIVDRYGRVINSNVFAKGITNTLSDVMVPLPAGAVQLGAAWQSNENFKIEGLGELIRLSAKYQLDSLEWESHLECAKIVGTLTSGNIRFNLLPGQVQSEGGTTITGGTTVFFAYRLGKVIKTLSTLEMNTMVDAAAVGNLANAQGAPPATAGPIMGPEIEEGSPEAAGAAQQPGAPAAGRGYNYNPYGPGPPGAGGYGYGSTGSTSQTNTARTSVKVRIISTMELVK